MAKAKEEIFELACPDCGAMIRVDAASGLVVSHTPAPRKRMFEDLETAAKAMREQDERKESIFRQSVDAVKNKADLMEKKFADALRKAKETLPRAGRFAISIWTEALTERGRSEGKTTLPGGYRGKFFLRPGNSLSDTSLHRSRAASKLPGGAEGERWQFFLFQSCPWILIHDTATNLPLLLRKRNA